MAQVTCLTCKYLLKYSTGDNTGECRRFPPIADRKWPGVDADDDWCGEHKQGKPRVQVNPLAAKPVPP